MRTLGVTDGDLDFTVVDGIEAVRQRVVQRLRFHRGEWFMNTELGVPYLADVLGYPLDMDVARQVISAYILSVEDVTEVDVTDVSFNPTTRQLSYKARVATTYGNMTMGSTA